MLIVAILSIFFIYMLLFSSNIQDVLNCRVKNFLKTNILFRQIMIFFTIFCFTFVLNWYTPENIYPNVFIDNISGLYDYFFLSFLIYFIFVLTTCLDIYFTIILFFLTFILIIVLVSKNDNNTNEKIDPKILFGKKNYYELSNIIQYLIVLIIVIGFIKNLYITKKITGKKFNLIKFLFTRGICE